MSEAETTTDREYFGQLEELFIALRGAPLLLSPSDWEVAREWRAAGIPLDLVERVLRDVFERSPRKAGRTGVRSLRYFDQPVRTAWEESLELGVVEGDRVAREIDVGSRLAALAASLPELPREMQSLARRVRQLSGPTQRVEEQLAEIDEEMLAVAGSSLSASETSALAERVEQAMARLEPRLDAREAGRLTERLRIRQLRALRSLPLLSLFSPDALPED